MKWACQLVCFNDFFKLKNAFIKEKRPRYFVITGIWFCPASLAFLLSHIKFRWKNTVAHVDMNSLQWSCFVTCLSDFQIPMMYCMEVNYTSELWIVDWFKVILNRGIDWKSVILGLQNNVLNCKIVRRLCSRLVTDKMYLLAKFVCTCFALMVPHWRTDRMSDYGQAPIVVELCFQAIAMVLDLSNATWYGQFQIFKMGMEW
jgi:hypothetical protein